MVHWFSRFLVLAFVGVAGCCAVGCQSGDDGGDRTPSVTAAVTTVATSAPIGLSPTAAPTAADSMTPEPAVTIELSATPQELTCDGKQASMVSARVLDRDGDLVRDGTAVRFSVQALGTADPIDAATRDGVAETSVIALGQQVGVVVNVTAGDAAMAIRIDCR
jgi:hypothetical protein